MVSRKTGIEYVIQRMHSGLTVMNILLVCYSVALFANIITWTVCVLPYHNRLVYEAF